jgi:hypothetical protein
MNNPQTPITQVEAADDFDTFLSRQLQRQQPYLDDHGFSAGVMAQLATAPKLNPWLAKSIVVLPVVLIALLVLSQFAWRPLVQSAYASLLSINSYDLLQWGICVLLIALVAPLVWLLKPE